VAWSCRDLHASPMLPSRLHAALLDYGSRTVLWWPCRVVWIRLRCVGLQVERVSERWQR